MSTAIELEPANNLRLANLCGPMNQHLREIEKRLGVEITHSSNQFKVTGDAVVVTRVTELIKDVYELTEKETLNSEKLHLNLQQTNNDKYSKEVDLAGEMVNLRRGVIKGRGQHQREYLASLSKFDVTFGIGPAGTGKTYLAVSSAVPALEEEKVQRLILVPPAVEGGGKVGFFTGGMGQKGRTYLRPIYGVFYRRLGVSLVSQMLEEKVF